ncbi:hypothetical protein AMATHDRAFT_5761 [Amanita thiersii Skay4041]|uniref:Cytochrome P450 n=1 Tax=Amanita thiersii Skay4041 TaxID=703135 RepID=A0A2A9NCW7_9AGAR|nr:hypothetical protein AMATHDRAFT_5761 [Amanita thiersii Skay4041]
MILLVLFCATLALIALRRLYQKKSAYSILPFPPGPEGLPLIGLWKLPSDKPWLTYGGDWAKKYGDMIFFKSFMSSFLVLNSAKRVRDIMDQRSSRYSSRPHLVMIMELMGWEDNFALMPYGSRWRRRRRAFHESFHSGVISQYQSSQTREVQTFLHNLLGTPQHFKSHIRFMFGATILDIIYGIKVMDWKNVYLTATEESVAGAVTAVTPGSFLVDVIPALKYVPSWFPGAGFKRFAEYQKRLYQFTTLDTFKYVKESIANGTARPSVVGNTLQHLSEDMPDDARREEEAIVRQMAIVAYSAGIDTSSAATLTFFCAMAMYPDVQKKAQMEIDAVVGHDRLPSLEDRDSLHYVNAIVKEITRWLPTAPLGLPHQSTEDDVYDGYFIPKGTVIIGNIWSIMRDPEMFPEPEEFRPERFLKNGKFCLSSALDPQTVVFGFGRRICPGRFLSDSLLYLTVASVLATFDILPPVDEHGHLVNLSIETTGGLVAHPIADKYSIKPRSEVAACVIQAALAQHNG